MARRQYAQQPSRTNTAVTTPQTPRNTPEKTYSSKTSSRNELRKATYKFVDRHSALIALLSVADSYLSGLGFAIPHY